MMLNKCDSTKKKVLSHFRTALDFAQQFQQTQAVEMLNFFMSVSL